MCNNGDGDADDDDDDDHDDDDDDDGHIPMFMLYIAIYFVLYFCY